MVIVKKRKQNTSVEQLIKALNQFIMLLEGQSEDEAVVDLKTVVKTLGQKSIKPEECLKALELIQESFEDKHELSAYTHARKGSEGTWSVADELYVASTSVLTLSNRLRASLNL